MQDNELGNEWDRTVDEVAKAMTSAPPDAQLAQRVAMRIAGLDAPRGRSRSMRAWILVPAAGVCVLLLAVFVARKKPVRLKPDATVATATRGETAQPTAKAAPVAAAPSRVPPARHPSIAGTAPPGLPPIDVERLDVAPLARVEQIEIDPIAIARIEIAPMP